MAPHPERREDSDMAELTLTLARSLLRSVRRRALPSTGKTAKLFWLIALSGAAMVVLPIAYLLVRVLAADPTLWGSILRVSTLATLVRTGTLALAVTGMSILIAMPLAWLTVRTDLPFRRIWAVLTALPLVIPSYVGAYLLVASLGPRGMLARTLELILGTPRLPLIYGFPGSFYILTILSYPYILLSLRAALQGLDPRLEEAARGLGHTPWQTFRRITLPQLRPALAAGSLLVALYVLRDFGAVSIMRYSTFTRVIYVQYQSAFDRTGAAALSLILVVFTLVILTLELRTRGRAQFHSGAVGEAVRPPVVPLRRWRWPATIFCALVACLALIIPASVLVYWLLRGLQAGEQIGVVWAAARNSMLASALAAAATIVFALPIAVVSVRSPSRFSHLIERLSYAGFALPGIVIALALVFFGANYAVALYQSLLMLVLAYVILFLPQAVGAVRSSLLQIHPNLEDAARGLGRRPSRVLAAITLPLLRPGVAAGISLVFLTTMKELPATLILGPFGFRTLATAVWSAVSEAFFARAAAPALVLILASSVPMAFILLRERV